jgi:hypothetical protein
MIAHIDICKDKFHVVEGKQQDNKMHQTLQRLAAANSSDKIMRASRYVGPDLFFETTHG